MAYLDKVETGKKEKPHFTLIYGPDGVGKTTFLADAEDPIVMPIEAGADNFNIAKLPEPKSYEEASDMVDELINTKHKYKTFGVDSLDHLEPLLWKKVCKDGGKDNIEEFGYGKGYVLALGEWQKFINKLKMLREKMNVILICHSQIKLFQDPAQGVGYDRYQLKLNEKAAALFRETTDSVLFANYEVFTKRDGLKTRAFGEGARVLFTERRPSFDAKNRHSLPFQMPLSYEDFSHAMKHGSGASTDKQKETITALLSQINDEPLAKTVMKTADGADSAKLTKIIEKLNLRVEALNG